MRTQFEFESYGEVNVKGYHWHQPGVIPKAIVVISHGMAETILRYDQFAEFLLASNIFVYGHSHRGHYETAGTADRLGYLGDNGWSKMVEDLNQVLTLAKSTYPAQPLFLLGHSMGSYVSRDYLLKYADQLDGVIISGTGFPGKTELKAAAVIAKLERKLKGKDLPSSLLTKMSFGSFNKTFKPSYTEFDWLSTDRAEVQKYIDNPWCGQCHPSSFFEEMASNLVRILYEEKPLSKKALPMYIMSGAEDPVGQFGKGVKQTADYYKSQGLPTTLKLYTGLRHELLNEVNKADVQQDILNWLNHQVE